MPLAVDLAANFDVASGFANLNASGGPRPNGHLVAPVFDGEVVLDDDGIDYGFVLGEAVGEESFEIGFNRFSSRESGKIWRHGNGVFSVERRELLRVAGVEELIPLLAKGTEVRV